MRQRTNRQVRLKSRPSGIPQAKLQAHRGSKPPSNPFVELVGFVFEPAPASESVCRLRVGPEHLNPNRVVHGAVLYAMADTGMGDALHPTLESAEMCATIEIKMTYFKAVSSGEILCRTRLINRGKRVAYLESSLFAGEALIAKASGSYAIFRPTQRAL